VAGERGHSAPSVLVDERGEPLTHPDYVDRMGAAHLQAGAWAFCRRPAAEAFGLPSGTDWVRDHSLALMFQTGSPYLPHPHLHDQIYVQRFGEDPPVLLAPVSSATPLAWSNEGSRIHPGRAPARVSMPARLQQRADAPAPLASIRPDMLLIRR
jgi:hypothetical protein